MSKLYEQCASFLLHKGDFEKAVNNFIQAGTDFVAVVREFPDLVPLPLHAALNIVGQGKKWQNQVLNRAASAMVQYCTYHRKKISRRAERAEKLKETGIGGNTLMMGSAPGAAARGFEPLEDEDEVSASFFFVGLF